MIFCWPWPWSEDIDRRTDTNVYNWKKPILHTRPVIKCELKNQDFELWAKKSALSCSVLCFWIYPVLQTSKGICLAMMSLEQLQNRQQTRSIHYWGGPLLTCILVSRKKVFLYFTVMLYFLNAEKCDNIVKEGKCHKHSLNTSVCRVF